MPLRLCLDTAPPPDASLARRALGRVVAAAARDGVLAIAEPGRVQVVHAPGLEDRWAVPLDGTVHAVAVAPGGGRIAVSLAGRVEVHGPEGPGRTLAVPGGAGCVAFGPSGALVAGSPSNATWVETGGGWGAFTTHTRRVLAVDRDGPIVLSGGADAQVAWTDLDAGKAQLFQGHVGAVRAVRLLPGGHALSASLDGTVRRWAAPAGDCLWVARPPVGAPASLAVHGDALLVGGESGVVAVLSLVDGAVRGVLPGHSRRVVALAPHGADGLASVAQDRSMRTWRCSDAGALPPLRGHVGGIRACAFGDGDLRTAGRDGTVRWWDPGSGAERGRVGLGGSAVQALLALPDGGLLAGGADGRLHRLGPDRRVCWVREPAHEGPVTSLGRLPGGLLLSGGADGVLRAWEPDAGAPLWAGPWHTERLRCLAVGPGDRVATGGYGGRVRVGEPLGAGTQDLDRHEGPVVGVAWCGDAVVSGGLDGVLRRHGPDGVGVQAHEGGVVGVRALGVDRVASAGRDGRVCVWRAADLCLLDALDLGVPLDGLGVAGPRLLVGDRRGGGHLLTLD